MHTQEFDPLFINLHNIRRVRHLFSPAPGLTSAQFHILRILHKQKKQMQKNCGTAGLKINELAKRLTQAAPTISQRVNELEDLGYVERTSDKADRRVTYVSLTVAGNEIVEKSFTGMQQTLQRIREIMGEDNAKEFARLSTLFSEAAVQAAKERNEPIQEKEPPIT